MQSYAMARKKQDQMLPTPSSATGLSATPAGGAGLERLGPEDFIVPRLMLVRPTGQLDGVEVGMFYLNLTGEQFAEVEVVFLRVSKGRVHFADANERQAIYGSADGIMPLPRFEPPMAPTCAECACSRWNGKEPPPCSKRYNLLGAMLETGQPFWGQRSQQRLLLPGGCSHPSRCAPTWGNVSLMRRYP